MCCGRPACSTESADLNARHRGAEGRYLPHGIEDVEAADGLYLLVEVGHVRGHVREVVDLRQGRSA